MQAMVMNKLLNIKLHLIRENRLGKSFWCRNSSVLEEFCRFLIVVAAALDDGEVQVVVEGRQLNVVLVQLVVVMDRC